MMSNVAWDAPHLAERYDRVSDTQFEKGRRLIGRMGVREGDAVLDVGCGTGRLALYVSNIIGPAGRIVGIDPSPHRVNVAKEKLQGRIPLNICFTIGCAERLDGLPDRSFDHAYYSSVFHWVEDKKAALGEAYRVLKPGGRVGMTTGDRDNPFTIRDISNRLFARPPYAGRVKIEDDASKPVTRNELETLLKEAGFTEIAIELRREKRYHPSPKEAFDFAEASSFGNSFRHVPEDLRAKALHDVAEELEKRRTPAGIELESNTLFAMATKPL